MLKSRPIESIGTQRTEALGRSCNQSDLDRLRPKEKITSVAQHATAEEDFGNFLTKPAELRITPRCQSTRSR